jgi:DNA-binding response OmpR family regulator
MTVMGCSKNIIAEILVAEDSPVQAEMLKCILEQHAHSVSIAQNGREALDYLKDHMPTLIISDILMPEMDGYQLCKTIKSDEKLNHIPVILLTMLSDPENIINGLECGADYFITKPYDGDLLLSRIQNVLQNREMRKGKGESIDKGIEIMFAGKKYVITSNRMQILNLLLSTYENAIIQNRELERMNTKLKEANETIKVLNGLLPTCAQCRKIRDDKGVWQHMESYIREHSEAEFTHSVCPECAKKLYPEYYDEVWGKEKKKK